MSKGIRRNLCWRLSGQDPNYHDFEDVVTKACSLIDCCGQAVKRIKYFHEYSDVLKRTPIESFKQGKPKVAVNHREECYWSGKTGGSHRYKAIGNVLSCAPEVRTCGRTRPVEEGMLKNHMENGHEDNSEHAVKRIKHHHEYIDVLNLKRGPIESFGKGMSKISMNHFQEECHWSGKTGGSRRYKATGNVLSYAPEVRTCGRTP